MNKVDNDVSELCKWDSIMQRQKLLAQDSIARLGDKIFSDFYFGMTKNEFETAKIAFKKETNGYVLIQNLKFFIEDPTYDNNKLSCLCLKATDVIERFNGMYISTDYESILKERYQSRLGLPDLFLDDDYQECDSTCKGLTHVIWKFDNRVFHLSFKKRYIREGYLAKYYCLYHCTTDYWNHTKEYFDEIYLKRQRDIKEREEKDKKYSDEL